MTSSTQYAKTQPEEKRKRARVQSRPCDACALRRVRCDYNGDKCSSCINHDLQCTNMRKTNRKSGPKRIHQKTRDNITKLLMENSLSQSASNSKINNNQSCNKAKIPVDNLLPYLQIYQTWFYVTWPVLSVTGLSFELTSMNSSDGFVDLDFTNASIYALCCSVCASISRHISFLASDTKIQYIQNNLSPEEYFNEAKRVIYYFNLTELTTCDSLLTSFFLFTYFTSIEGESSSAIIYLREAITKSQIMNLHDPKTYTKFTNVEGHKYRKIYYLLLVSERAMSSEHSVPPTLNDTIQYPSLEDEETPGLLSGFIELVKLFSVPGKIFFSDINNKSDIELRMANDFRQKQSLSAKRSWILEVQSKLNTRFESEIMSHTQRLNIILSQAYIQALAWNITLDNNLIRDDTLETVNSNYFSSEFPLKIAKDFLTSTKDLSIFAFESNGPGVCVKLLKVADILRYSINKSHSSIAFDYLHSIFHKIKQLKMNPTISKDIYYKLGNFINSRMNVMNVEIQRPPAFIELLDKEQNNFSDYIRYHNVILGEDSNEHEDANKDKNVYEAGKLNEDLLADLISNISSQNEVNLGTSDSPANEEIWQYLLKSFMP